MTKAQPPVAPATIPHVTHERSYGDCPSAKVVRVHDGDTIIVSVSDWPPVVGDQIAVRLFGFDAPEIHDTRPSIRAIADKARLRMVELCKNGVTLVDLRRDKYFRLLASLHVGPVDLASVLKNEGLVRPYTGEGAKPW